VTLRYYVHSLTRTGSLATHLISGVSCFLMPQGDYCSSKFAAYGFAESIRREVQSLYGARRVRFVTVCPGLIRTGMFDGVQLRYPWLTPELDVDAVVAAVLVSAQRGPGGGHEVRMPLSANFTELTRFLPTWLHDLVCEVRFANRCTDFLELAVTTYRTVYADHWGERRIEPFSWTGQELLQTRLVPSSKCPRSGRKE
jgi:hypothetical protein